MSGKNSRIKIGFLLAFLFMVLSFCVVRAEEPVTVSSYTELVTAVSDGGDIVFGSDISLTANLITRKDITLDLNGHTLNTAASTLAVFSNLTLKDTSSAGTGKITGTGNFKIQVGSGTSVGHLIMESGTVETTKSYGIRVPAKGTFTLNGGMVKAPSYSVYDEGNFIMNGGSVIATSYPAVQVKGTEVKEMLTMNGGLVESLGDGAAINFHSNAAGIINGGTIRAMYADPAEKKGGLGISAYKNTRVTINGGTVSSSSHALTGNGSDSGTSEGTNAKFIITGGTLNSAYGPGIYAPQVNGETIISGGTITGGRTGVEVRAGTLTITGGVIKGNEERYEVVPNDNGLTTLGTAVSVRQHTTKQPITLNISGGTFYGFIPLSESNPLGNSAEDIAKINYDVSGGVFYAGSGADGETVHVEDYPNGKFIWGGKYTHWVTQYVKDGYGEKPVGDPAPNMIAVYKWYKATLEQAAANGVTTITRNRTESDDGTTVVTIPDPNPQNPIPDPEDPDSTLKVHTLYNDEVYLECNPAEDCAVLNIKVLDENGNEISVNENNMYLAPNSNSYASVHYVKMIAREVDPSVSVDDIDLGVRSKAQAQAVMLQALKNNPSLLEAVSNTNPTLELVIEKKIPTDDEKNAILEKVGSQDALILAFYDVYVSVKDEAGNEVGKIRNLPEKIEFVMVLPDDLALTSDDSGSYYVLGKNREYYMINAAVSEDGRSRSFATSLLSNYALVFDDVSEENNENTENNESGADDNESETIYSESENEDSQSENLQNESSENNEGDPNTGDGFSGLFALILASTVVLVFII